MTMRSLLDGLGNANVSLVTTEETEVSIILLNTKIFTSKCNYIMNSRQKSEYCTLLHKATNFLYKNIRMIQTIYTAVY